MKNMQERSIDECEKTLEEGKMQLLESSKEQMANNHPSFITLDAFKEKVLNKINEIYGIYE
ncbi:MAG: hypothetical protein LKF33_06335 [Prevotella sp.]|jgi:hypothetical protein|nr:hypothetical protein [Prevotella sp.]